MSGSANNTGHLPDQQNIDQEAWIIKLPKPVRRVGSGSYLVYVLVSFVISVSATRLFLSITNYTQLGGGEIHISHILWGGLFLFISTLLLLMISNRQIYKVAAILSGIGIGLFIDEVGKFITQQNDYFYPLAAPIIYIFFMLFLILVIRLQRQAKPTPRAELYRTLETLQDWIDAPLSDQDEAALIERLKTLSDNVDSENLDSLAGSIIHVIQSDPRPGPIILPARWEIYKKRFDQSISERGLRLILAIGLLLMAVMAVKNPASDLMNSHLPTFWGSLVFGAHSGRWLGSEIAPGLYQARVALEIALGSLLFVNSLLLFYKKARLGIPLGFGILIFYLTAIDPLLFYFEQFSSIFFVGFQYLLLTGLIYYRTHFLPTIKL
jgi:hypothetical protein